MNKEELREQAQSQLEAVYQATSNDDQRKAYNDWAAQYEADLFAYGQRFPWMTAAVFTRFIDPGDGPILDAGCGTGLQIEPIVLAGYGPVTGIDLSEGMMAVAREKNLYAELRQMTLGEKLDFPNNHFAHTITAGTITPGHAPPESFEELIRITRSGGNIVISLRTDEDVDPAYPAALELYESQGFWTKRFQSAEFAAMPLGEPAVRTTVFVYEIT